MLRIHFTGADLARTHIAATADPLWEIVMSLQVLQSRYGRLVFDGWRRASRAAARGAGIQGELRLLFGVAPDARYFPDFLTPLEGLLGLDEGVEAVTATPARRIRNELALLDTVRGTPSWAWDLASGRAAGLNRLRDGLRAYHRTVLAPGWDRVEATLDAHRAPLLRARRSAGVSHLLANLWPVLRWQPPVLVGDYFTDRDIHLDGRGITLIPSYFCWKHPVPLYDTDLPPVLVYPVDHVRDGLAAGGGGSGALADLIGASRAAVLRAAADGATTGDLARRCGISPATASRHATVLRNSGLISSHRDANMIVHVPTGLGHALLRRALMAR